MQLHVKSLSCFIWAQKRKSKQDQDVEANIIFNYIIICKYNYGSLHRYYPVRVCAAGLSV